jgi:putative endonuclease
MQPRDGQRWENVAGEYLEAHGLCVLARGYRCRLGELDLVCREDGVLVVVEVKARSSNACVSAVHSVGPYKRARIILATRHLLMSRAEWRGASIRFDVVAIDAIDTPAPRIHWIKRAFDAG